MKGDKIIMNSKVHKYNYSKEGSIGEIVGGNKGKYKIHFMPNKPS